MRLEYMICIKVGEGGQKRGRMVYLNAYTMQQQNRQNNNNKYFSKGIKDNFSFEG